MILLAVLFLVLEKVHTAPFIFLLFCFSSQILQHLFKQATIRQPVVRNMMKALYFQFTAGVLPLYAVVFMGYWAYGSRTSTYLLSSVSGPVWLKALANIAAFLQTVIALHVCIPIFLNLLVIVIYQLMVVRMYECQVFLAL